MVESKDGSISRSLKFVFKSYPFNYQSATVERWARSLLVFRFVGMWGGHANDDDEFTVSIPFAGIDELKDLVKILGFTIPYVGFDVAQPEPGKTYSPDEYRNFPSLIGEAAPGYAQPCWTRVMDEEAFVYIYDGRISIKGGTTKDDPWFRGERTFLNVQRLDQKLAELELSFLEPPSPSKLCLSPAVYPEVWAGDPGAWAKLFEEESRSRKTGLEEEERPIQESSLTPAVKVSVVPLQSTPSDRMYISKWTFVWRLRRKPIRMIKRLFHKVLDLLKRK